MTSWALIQSNWCLYKKRQFRRHEKTTGKMLEDTVGRWTSASQTGLWGNPICQHLILDTSSRTEKISFYYWSHPFCDTLLWQPWKTNAPPNRTHPQQKEGWEKSNHHQWKITRKSAYLSAGENAPKTQNHSAVPHTVWHLNYLPNQVINIRTCYNFI
jgi:hypothetical protein